MPDMTEPNRASGAEAIYRSLVDNLQGAVYHCEAAVPWRMTHLSAGVLPLTGRAAADFTSGRLAWANIVWPDDLAGVDEAVQTGLASRTAFTMVYRIIHADGTVRWVHERGQGIFRPDGSVDHLEGVILDITDRYRTEAALRDSERRHRALFETMQAGVVYQDASGAIIDANPAAQRILGLTLDQMQGRTSMDPRWRAVREDGSVFPGAEHPAVVALKTGRPVHGVVMGVDHAGLGSERRWILIDAVPEIAADRRTVARVFTTFTDITERKGFQAQLLQAQKLEAIGQLAGGVAHDFNNILAAMMLQLGALEEMPGLPPEAADGVQQLSAAARRAADLTRQLLLFSRRQVMQNRRLDVNAVVHNLLKMARRLLGEHIEVPFDTSPGPLWVDADPGMLEQLLMNLFVNARDAMPRGGRLSLAADEVDVDPSAAAQHADARVGRFVRLRVTDTGVGMDEATQARIFEPFFTTKASGLGTGLGLATAYGIVRQHRGWIGVQSEPGAGTTFTVCLPRSPEPGEATAEAARTTVRGGHETILLVEDDADVRLAARAGLQRAGYQVIEASSGLDALRVWEQHDGRVDLLFSDMVMPGGISGLELAGRLRDLRPGLKVIVSSGYSVELARAGGAAIEDIRFIPKPWHPSELLTAVRDILDAS